MKTHKEPEGYHDISHVSEGRRKLLLERLNGKCMENADLTITEIVSQSYATALEKGWWDQGDRPIGEALMLIVCEVAEAMEEFRNGRDLAEIWYGENDKPEGLPVELADVIIRIGDLCGRYNIPLLKAITEKLEYNKTRSYRHGNKQA